MSFLITLVIVGLTLLLGGLMLFTLLVSWRVQMALPAAGRFVKVMGNRIHYIEEDRSEGNQPAILMIHGLTGVAQNFTYSVVSRLSQHYLVIAIDRPGSGYSTRHPHAAATLDVQADIVAGVIDALGLDKPLVVGHSLGGAVALATALRYPDKVAGLALIAPLTHMPSDTPQVFSALTIRWPWVRRLIAWTLPIPLSFLQTDNIMPDVFGPEQVPADFPVRGGGLLGLRPSQFIGASADVNALPDSMLLMQQQYPNLSLPVAVLYGKQDRILDYREQGQALAEVVSGCELELIEGGHMLPITQPELTADFIARCALPLGKHNTH